MTGRWGPAWPEVVAALETLGWGDAVPLREVRDGGYSPASRWIVERSGGARAFVKARAARADGTGDPWFDAERVTCEAQPGTMIPVLHAWSSADGGPRVLVLEDLSQARWGAPVTVDDAGALREALDELTSVAVPGALRALPLSEDVDDDDPWVLASSHGDVLEQLGLFDVGWLARNVDTLVAASSGVVIEGDQLVHGDLWRQNWCRADRGAVIVDWTGAARGNGDANLAWGEAGVRAAGGPAGIVLARDDPGHDAWAARMAGLAALFLALDVERAPELPRLHATQAREAMAAVGWACDALEIESPTFAPALLAHGAWEP